MKQGITIYRGSHQIGGCTTEIKTEGHRIVIDFGSNLPRCQKEGAMTDDELVEAVFGDKPCDGVLFSHYHGDHIGMYKRIPKGIPLYIGATAKKILKILTEKLDTIPGTADPGLQRVSGMKPYYPNRRMEGFGDILVTPYIVGHSALDAYMFLIEVSGKKILFTGDFREHGIIGGNGTLEKAVRAYIGEVDILITEGTLLSRVEEAKRNPIQTEEDLGKRAKELFLANRETVLLVSSTNLDTIMEFYHALPGEMGFICDAYQAKVMLTAMKEKGKYYRRYQPKMVNGKPRTVYIVGDMEGLGAKENCEKADFSKLKNTGFAMLAREKKPLFAKIMAKFPDPLVIYSKWAGYLEGKYADPNIQAFIGSHRMEKLHTSGHAYVESIKKLIDLTNPNVIIPMHTECAGQFGNMPEFAPYKDRITELRDGETFAL